MVIKFEKDLTLLTNFLAYVGIRLHGPPRKLLCIPMIGIAFPLLHCLIIFRVSTDFKLKDVFLLFDVCNLQILSYVKASCFLLHHKQIKKLIEDKVCHFWSVEDFPVAEARNKCLEYIKFYSSLWNVNFLATMFGATLIFLCAWIPPRKLPLYMYESEYIPWFINYAFQCYVSTGTFTYIVGFSFFSFLMMHWGVVQFKLINARFEAIDFQGLEENSEKLKIAKNEMRVCVKHHKFIVDYVKKLDDIISITYMLLFIIDVVSLCFELAVMNIMKPDSVDSAKAITFIYSVLVEMFFSACLPSQLLNDEAQKISKSIYMNNWYESNIPSLRKNMLIIMQQSEIEVFIKGWKFFQLRIATFIAVVKSTYSYFMILQHVTSDN